eukprot:536408-Pleurochrysis_carterae.AAC.1
MSFSSESVTGMHRGHVQCSIGPRWCEQRSRSRAHGQSLCQGETLIDVATVRERPGGKHVLWSSARGKTHSAEPLRGVAGLLGS